MNPWAIVAVVASVGKAYATYQQGMATKAYYDAKADEALLKYKSKEVEAKEQGVKVLKATNDNLSEMISKAAASGVMPMEGSAATAQIASLRVGSEEFAISMINQELMQNLGLLEFKNLKTAGKQAKKAGIMGAIFGLGTDIATVGQAGGFEKTEPVIDTNKYPDNPPEADY
jgi:hypothetical protein